MQRAKLFIWLAAISGYTGIGMVLGWLASDQVDMTPLWIGIVMIFLGSVLTGMYISSRQKSTTNDSSVAEDKRRIADSTAIDTKL